jgi:hypothetical protein
MPPWPLQIPTLPHKAGSHLLPLYNDTLLIPGCLKHEDQQVSARPSQPMWGRWIPSSCHTPKNFQSDQDIKLQSKTGANRKIPEEKHERIFVITPKQLNRPFHNFLSIPEAINSKID